MGTKKNFFKRNLNGLLVGSQYYIWPEIKGLIDSLIHPTSQAHFQKLSFNLPPLRPVVKNFWRSEMAETALSGAVPALPVVRPGKQKGFCCWYSRICFELSPWFSRFTLHFTRLSRIFSRVWFRLSREHSRASLELCISWLNLRSPVVVYSTQISSSTLNFKASSFLFSQSAVVEMKLSEMITTTWKQINQLLHGGYSSSSHKLSQRFLLGPREDVT